MKHDTFVLLQLCLMTVFNLSFCWGWVKIWFGRKLNGNSAEGQKHFFLSTPAGQLN